jgi:hypothetical protein
MDTLCRSVLVIAAGLLLATTVSTVNAQQTPTGANGGDHRSVLDDPSLFGLASDERQTQVSALTETVAQLVRPIIIRSSPMQPAQRNNFIDEYVFGQIETAGIESSPLSSDTEFLRRVMLDLTGRLPSGDEVVDFVNDRTPGKREARIDTLVASPEFVDKWTLFFGDLLKLNGPASNVNRYTQGRDAFYLFLKDSLAQNKPYDQLVRELITATGDNHSNGAANFPVGGIVPMGPIQDTYDGQAVQVASMFLGIQVVDCLLCHDGAGRLDSVNLWGSQKTRLEMWGLSAFFANTLISRQRISTSPTLRRYTVSDRTRRPGYFLDTIDGNRSTRAPQGSVVQVEARYPFALSRSVDGTVSSGQIERASLANYVTGDPQFARATVNYIWEEFMVEAFVTPSNAFDPARLDPENPPPEPWTLQPTNARLLQALASWFQETNFDLRQLARLIAKSRAYQLSAAYPTDWKPEYVSYYARKFARRLDAEEIHDAIIQATGVPANYPIRSRTGTVLPPVQWAMQLPDTREPLSNRRIRQFLDSFGRGDRDQTPRSEEGSPLQALNLMNHDFVMSRINAGNRNSTIGRILRDTDDSAEIIRQLYLATLSRFPTARETALLLPMMGQLGNRDGAESLQWVLMNKLDFVFNY